MHPQIELEVTDGCRTSVDTVEVYAACAKTPSMLASCVIFLLTSACVAAVAIIELQQAPGYTGQPYLLYADPGNSDTNGSCSAYAACVLHLVLVQRKLWRRS